MTLAVADTIISDQKVKVIFTDTKSHYGEYNVFLNVEQVHEDDFYSKWKHNDQKSATLTTTLFCMTVLDNARSLGNCFVLIA